MPLSNDLLALRLEEVADVLAAQDANPYRVQAWRRAADTVRHLPRPVHAILGERGQAGLLALAGIGSSLARAIEQLVATDHLPLLDRLRGGAGSLEVFATVPGIGPELARRIHEQLGIESLFELEVAAHDGRLAKVPGMGAGRVRAVRESLAGRFRRGTTMPESTRRRMAVPEPPVTELLDVDHEYRDKAGAERLPRIAPKRFNPTGEAWLPILHAVRGPRHYTALFSNTERAHRLGTTHDWVVIYRDDGDGDGQWTVVTATSGDLAGRRIVRGREAECAAHYANTPADATP